MRNSEAASHRVPDGVEYDVHGVVGVRLVNASGPDVAAVDRQLGPFRSRLLRDPEIVIRYVHELPARHSPHIEVGASRFTSGGLCVLGSGAGTQRAAVALDSVGERCEIVCEHGLAAVPLLLPIVNLAAMARGAVAVHASAVSYNGTGVLMPAWAHGGKTTGMLAFATQGAEYVGDEWVLLSRGGERMCGLPQPVAVQGWQLRQLPAMCRELSTGRRLALTADRLLDAATAADRGGSGGSGSRSLRHRLLTGVRRRLSVSIDPLRLPAGVRPAFSAPLDTVLFMIRHSGAGVHVQRVPPADMAGRIAASTGVESAPLTTAYLAYRCAFPDRTNRWLESARDLEAELLARALREKETFVVYHPARCGLAELFNAMAPVCGLREGELTAV